MRIFTILLLTLLLLLVGGSAEAQPDEWEQVAADGAVCARGTPYSFFVHAGDPEKLMIYFQGGGACWGAETCREGGTFDDSVEPDELNRYRGIFDFGNPTNPLVDYSVVVVAYCTGDVHTGAAERRFRHEGTPFTVHFDGFANAQAALDWTYQHYQQPSDLIIAGSSAGAYGAIFHAPYVLAHYHEARALVFADAGIGVVAPQWDGLATWGTLDNLYTGEEFSSVTSGASFGGSLYQAAAQAFPSAQFVIYSSAADQVQTGFYLLQGGEDDWSAELQARIAELSALENVHAYIAWGGTHAILPTPLFYLMQVNGVSLRDWLADLVDGETVPSVLCDDCLTQELVEQ